MKVRHLCLLSFIRSTKHADQTPTTPLADVLYSLPLPLYMQCHRAVYGANASPNKHASQQTPSGQKCERGIL